MTLRLGVGISNSRENKVYPSGFTSAASLRAVAEAVEAAGFWSLWLNDLITTHDDARTVYPEPPNFYEVQTTCGFLAAVTSRVRLLTASITMPLRDPIILAKETATLDQLSGGRYLLGLGLGGKRTEFERLRGRFAAKANRGKWLDESLEVLHLALSEPVVNYEGSYFSIRDAEMFPKPVQRPYPLYLTGGGEEMLRRTARWAKGWIHMNVSPEETTKLVGDLAASAREIGTDVSGMDVCLLFDLSVAETHAAAEERWARSCGMAISKSRGRGSASSALLGTPLEILEQLRRYEAAGATHVGLLVTGNDPAEVLEQVALLGRTVVPELS